MLYQPGDILLDKYRIEAHIGQGAFGDVYLATHLKLNVPRALKILRRDAPGVGSSEFNDGKARFQLEARLGAQLNTPSAHPNLLIVHNFEEHEQLLLLEMEYASGGNLAERLDNAREQGKLFPIEEALQIALDIASALAALHARDIVHRDIKPSNILFDSNGHAKLADLGLAQMPGGPSLRSQLSNPLPHPGTPAYMSPEQELSGSYLTPASDIYALGVTLFEVLTGRAYRNQRPGMRASKLRAEILVAVDDLLVRMLAADAKARPWDGKECADLLRAALAKSADPLPPPKKKQPTRALTVTLSAFGLLLSAGAIFLVWKSSIGMAVPTQTALAGSRLIIHPFSLVFVAPAHSNSGFLCLRSYISPKQTELTRP